MLRFLHLSFSIPLRRDHSLCERFGSFFFLTILASAFLFYTPFASAQAPSPATKRPVESEIALVSGGSFGAIHVFAYAGDRRINTIGFEYDRNSWGKFLNSRVDYVGELLPVVGRNSAGQLRSG